MRNKYSNRGSPLKPVLMAVGAVLTLVLVTVATLWVSGRFTPIRPAPRPGPPEGTIAVPITAQAVPAYSRLIRDHFWNKKTGQFAMVYLYPKEIGPGMLTSWDDIRGRVLAVDKAPGYAINERDLLPKGTRPGLVAGIPPGKRALVLEASRIHGIHGLQLGDHVDLIASVPVDAKPLNGRDVRSMLMALQPAEPLSKGKKKAQVVVLAEDAVVVSPVTVRYLPAANAARGKGPEPKGKPIEEVVIAVESDEVLRVSESLAVEAAITAVAHSGHPDSPHGSIKPAAATAAPPAPTVIEIIHGGKRNTMIFTPDGKRLGEAPGSPDVIPATALGQ